MQAEELRKLSEALIQFYEKLSAWEIAVARNSGLSTQQNHTIAIVGSAGRIRMKPLAEKLG
ncbi:MAG: MarR family transcriptional regulator, partial [Deltaproteobacteria bacterium]|nr:MarR family transcriptional regulator [Deltaproteobacteria bacterium]